LWLKPRPLSSFGSKVGGFRLTASAT